MTTLQGTADIFDGITVRTGDCESIEGFADALTASLDTWRRQGRRLVWLEIALEHSSLIPVALEAGFEFHHARLDHVTLTLRLVPGVDFPADASHYIGAGGAALSDGNELLVVRERYPVRDRPNPWKLPGGLVEAGERLEEGVTREVREETGVETEFQGVSGFGHVTSWFLGKPSLYFVCRLRPLSMEITIDEREIAEARWMPVEEFLASDDAVPFNKRMVRAVISGLPLAPAELEGDHAKRWELLLPE